jgi:hypothetical protein
MRCCADAATRHLVCTLTVVGLLLLPMLSAVLPGWRVPIRLMATAAPDAADKVQRARLTSPLVTGSDAGVSSPVVASSAESLQTPGRGIDISWSTALASSALCGRRPAFAGASDRRAGDDSTTRTTRDRHDRERAVADLAGRLAVAVVPDMRPEPYCMTLRAQ